jgi:hypothetical protein
MTRYEYMQLKLSNMPVDVIAHYHLHNIATPNGYVYCKNLPRHVWAPASEDHCAGAIGKKTERTRLHPEQNNTWAVNT